MKILKSTLAGALITSALLAGCSAQPTAVTEDNASTDFLKSAAKISSESSADDLISVFEEMIDATYDKNEGGLILAEDASGTTLDAENTEEIAKATTTLKNYDVRVATDSTFYQLYEEKSSAADSIYGVMASDAKGVTTVYTTLDESKIGDPKADMTVDTITSSENEEEYSAEEMKEYNRNSVIYPFYTMLGATLVLQPTYAPEYYDYSLMKQGDDYVWTISIKDEEEYNSALDETFETYYGHSRLDLLGDESLVLDTYDVTKIDLVITMDENGAISKIVNDNASLVEQGDISLDLASTDTVTVSGADENWTVFFESFFAAIQNKSLAEGDTFAIGQALDQADSTSTSAASSEKESKDDSKEDSAADSKDESKADSKSESKEESKASSQSKADSSAKASSTKDSSK